MYMCVCIHISIYNNHNSNTSDHSKSGDSLKEREGGIVSGGSATVRTSNCYFQNIGVGEGLS